MSNLKIKYRIYLTGTGAILGMLVFTSMLLWERRQVVHEMRDLIEIAELGPDIGALVHELQRERGASAGVLASGGGTFDRTLRRQRLATDESLVLLQSAFDAFDAETHHKQIIDRIGAVRRTLVGLDKIRDRIDVRSLTPERQWISMSRRTRG